MKSIRMTLTAFLLVVPVAIAVSFPQYVRAQRAPEARDIVARAQEDVRHAQGFARPRGKEQERFDNAQRSLSKVDRSFSKGKFDKGRLDDAIRDVQNIVDHNTISSQDRDSLNQDLGDLRALRSRRG